MFELKPLSREAIPAALAKAERYRLLSEPAEAESICLDVLERDPDHQEALRMLLLALTDQFEERSGEAVGAARQILQRLGDEYERAYYSGIIQERHARARLRQARPGCGSIAYEQLRQAMACYEQAEALRPPGNDDALLRWNTCARLIMGNPHLEPAPTEPMDPLLSE
jgi:tetratricopeptide (TPR) repeat protein